MKDYLKQEELKHYGMLGMHWGVTTKSGSSSGKRKQSRFSKSLEQKYGHKTMSSLLSAVNKDPAVNMAKRMAFAYGAYKVTELVVGAIPRIAWATGKIISNVPLR